MQNVTKRDDIRILKTMKSLLLIMFYTCKFNLSSIYPDQYWACQMPPAMVPTTRERKKKSSFLENAKSLIHQWALSVLQDFSFFLLLSIWQPRETQNEAAYMAWLRKYFVMEEFEGFIGKIPEK